MNSITKNIDSLKEILQNLINEEFETFLADLKTKNPDQKYYRNGTYTINYNSEIGNIKLRIPRIRNIEFKSTFLSKSSYSDKIVSLCISLYSNGLSTSRISSTLYEVFGIDISKTTVSLFTSELDKNVNTYFSNQLEDEYLFIHLDAKYFSVRNISSNKSALISAIGVTKDGKKKHIHMNVIKRESKKELISFLTELKDKLILTSPSFVIDGAEAMPSAIYEVFGDVPIQRCLVHVVRNAKKVLKGFATSSDIKSIETKLNYLFFECKNCEVEKCITELFSQFPNQVNKLKNLLKCKHIFTYLGYPESIGKLIKTNNTIEQFHSNLEAVTKQHRTYPDEASLYRSIIKEIERYNQSDTLDEPVNFQISQNKFETLNIIKNFKQADYITIEIRKSGRLLINKEINKMQYREIQQII